MNLQAIATYFKCLFVVFIEKRLIRFPSLVVVFFLSLSLHSTHPLMLSGITKINEANFRKYFSTNFPFFFFFPNSALDIQEELNRSGLDGSSSGEVMRHFTSSLRVFYSSTKSLFLVEALPLHPHHSPLVTLFSAESRQAFGRQKSLATREDPAKMLLR